MKNNLNSYVNILVGLHDKDTKKQEIKTKKAYKIINNLLFKKYRLQGATLQDAKGTYLHSDGSNALVEEQTISIILLFIDDLTVNNIVADLKSMLNQESILVLKQKMDVQFM